MESISQSKDYSYLIQPIRDLAENWNIDISKELEDYLSDLDKISFTFDGGDQNKSFNFAEAALLIQGSAVIYSKKVEYLYNLLFQTLDLLAQRRKRKDNTSIMADGTDRDIQLDDEVEFLALDDILVADENIDLNEGDEEENGEDGSTRQNKGKTLIEFSNNDSNYKIALMNNAGSNDHRAMLDSLNDDNDDEQVNPDTKKQLFINNNANDLKRSDFRMNDAIVSRSGAMVLRGLDFLDHESLLQRPVFNQFENQYLDNDNSNNANDQSLAFLNDENKLITPPDFDTPQLQQEQQEESLPATTDENVNNENKQSEISNNNNDDWGNFGEAKDDSSDDEHNEGMGDIDDDDEDRLKELNSNGEQDPNKRPMKSEKSTKKSKPTTRDAWELLDPFEDSGNKPLERPFKKGKTFVIPFALLDSEKQKKQKKKIDEGEKKKQSKDTIKADSATSMSNPAESILQFPDESLPLRGCYFKELAYLYNKNIQQTKKKLKDINGVEESDLNGAGLELLPEEDIGRTSGYYGGNTFEPSNNNGNGNGNGEYDGEGNGPSWDDDWGDYGAAKDDSSDEDDANGLPTSATIEHYDGPFDGNQYNFDNVNIPDANSARVEHYSQPTQTYEELCRSYVEKYLESASKYVRETALSQRVNEWNNRLMPILQEQDSHPSFDIHTYGNKFLYSMKPYATNKTNQLDNNDDTEIEQNLDDEDTDPTLEINKEAVVSFRDITKQSPVYEICRMFTSCLQLANNGNIEIIQPESKDDIEQLNFHLLTLKKKHDIEALMVPSQHKSLLDDDDEEQNELINKHIENSTPKKKNNNKGKKKKKTTVTTTTTTTTRGSKRQIKKLKQNEEEEDEQSEQEQSEEEEDTDEEEEEESSDDEKVKKKQKTSKKTSKATKSKPKSKKLQNGSK
ncbi:hypothetical protein DICPUDRAFT_97786 [Dictyostelium purpureum]|uniref:Condensin-2 complex subunit H2 n=1 Tax=Dictyostelium purpureum TaxID=5786 RepID=F0ZJT6_DICPU|nr:uncharacterized protein DICPUDRAFT_97786 [Dictyostelium purpureum]EGC35780.1 hypothetical protein DICPUDRAFT_97786 [Dictyostelium purpureum]|eukprot:XP_003287674.1 hypothetical protein DICPUDRAFT_97786 [Dictyostelium purpureum]